MLLFPNHPKYPVFLPTYQRLSIKTTLGNVKIKCSVKAPYITKKYVLFGNTSPTLESELFREAHHMHILLHFPEQHMMQNVVHRMLH